MVVIILAVLSNKDNDDELNEIIKAFNKIAKACYEAELQRALSSLENDVQRSIFLDWWHGGSLWKWNSEEKCHERADKYKDVSDRNWEEVCSVILETINRGFG